MLWRSDPRRGRIVVARCPVAASAGVRLRMSIAEATDWLRRSGRAFLAEEHDRAADSAAIRRVAEVFQREISPLVGLESLDRFIWAGRTLHLPESLICDLSGAAHLFGGEAGVITAAREILSRMNLQGRLAIADSVGTAWAVANHGRHDPDHHGRHDPDRVGQAIVPVGRTRQALQSIPVSGLRLAPETVATLDKLGVETIGGLLRLPRSGLAPRLGGHLVMRIAQALGEVDEPLPVIHGAPEDTASSDLEYPSDDLTILLDRIDRLLEKIRAGLATRGCGALHLTCRLDLAVHPPLTVNVGLFAATLDTRHWLQMIRNGIEAQTLKGPVKRITVSVPHTHLLAATQTHLFDDSTTAIGGSRLARLIDSLGTRLGRDNVRGVRLSEDPLPENACQVFPLAGRSARSMLPKTGRRSSRSAGQKNPEVIPALSVDGDVDVDVDVDLHVSASGDSFPDRHDVMRRPLELLPRPESLQPQHREPQNVQSIRSVVPTSSSGVKPCSISPRVVPDGFRYAGQSHKVVRCWGPERIETAWWAGHCVRRDYFRIETDRGQWWWIFKDLSLNDPSATISPWKLHGIFA